MLKGKYCMKKWSRLDPDHFLSLALSCPRSLILQQLNIFKVFFMRHLGLVDLLANMLVGRSRFETGWVIELCTCTKYFLCGLHNVCHHIMARLDLFILSLSLSLSPSRIGCKYLQTVRESSWNAGGNLQWTSIPFRESVVRLLVASCCRNWNEWQLHRALGSSAESTLSCMWKVPKLLHAYLWLYEGGGTGAMRSMSESSLAAATARMNIAVCFISCLE